MPNVGSRARKGKAETLSTLDRQNINRVLQQDPDFLLKLGMWGRTSGELKEIQMSIVLTVATYAAGGWNKIPSHKQARHVVDALNTANEAGFTGKTELELSEEIEPT